MKQTVMARFSKIKISSPFVLLMIVCNSLALFVNLLVGLMVYQNPLLALKDKENMLYIFCFGTVLSLGIYLIASFVIMLERLTGSRR